MIAAAYAYANGDGDMPLEVDMNNLIDRYGASVVLGSPTPLWILNRLRASDAVMKSYTDREHSPSYTEWEQAHPAKARLLHLALRAAIDLKMVRE